MLSCQCLQIKLEIVSLVVSDAIAGHGVGFLSSLVEQSNAVILLGSMSHEYQVNWLMLSVFAQPPTLSFWTVKGSYCKLYMKCQPSVVGFPSDFWINLSDFFKQFFWRVPNLSVLF